MSALTIPHLHSPLMAAHQGNPELADCYNVMLDVDSIILPLLDVMASRPGGARVAYADCPAWEALPDLVDGGLPRMLEMFSECFRYETMRNFSPFPGASEMTGALAGLGVRFHVKTERPAAFARDTARYLDAYSIPYVTLRCDMPLDKVSECQAESVHVAVDDHPRFIANATAAGIAVMTLSYPYNADACADSGAPHADTWAELGVCVMQAVENRLRAALAH